MTHEQPITRSNGFGLERGSILPAKTFAMLDAAGERRRYRAGAALFLTGDLPGPAFGVIEGTVLLSVPGGDGDAVILERVGTGMVFGELAAIDGLPRSADAIAETDCEVAAVSPGAFNALIEHEPTLAANLLRLLAERLRVTTGARVTGEPNDVVARVAGALVDLARCEGQVVGTVCVIAVTQEELARRVDVGREQLSKALAHLQATGWLATAPGRLELLNLPAIARHAREDPQ